jgi:nucleoside-diphosphate-sugar epimerase
LKGIVEAVRLAMQRDFGLRPPAKARHVPGALADGARTLEVLLEGFGLASSRLRQWSELNLSASCDIGPARRDLGYAPQVELREGMRRQVAWMLEQGLYL